MQDLRLAFRSLRATPVVSIVAALSLALGIGANTAIFSIVNSLLLRTLPVADPERLMTIAAPRPFGPGLVSFWTYPIWEQIRQRPELFDGALASGATRFNLASRGETQFVNGLWASGSFFETLGVRPILGRTFSPTDDQRGGGPDGAVAVISYGFWQRRFGGAADAIGRRLELDRVPFTVVGVTPPDFFGPDVGRTFDVVVPLGTEPLVHGRGTWLEGTYFVTLMVRLKPGQTIEAAEAALRSVQPQIRQATLPDFLRGEFLERYLKAPFVLQPSATGNSNLRGRYQRPLLTIMAVVALVLVIACANIANLLLARATARRHELSVRVALGASRGRLVRQLVAESALLAVIGTAGGMLIASWGSRLLVRQLSTQTNTVFLELSMDWRVLAFTIGVAIATVLLFGVAPALRASAVTPMAALKEHGRGTSGDPRLSLSNGLVVAQVALSVVLVVAAGLFVRTFASLATLNLGFERDRVLLVDVNAERPNVEPAARLQMYDRIREAVRAVPGVTEAALSKVTPVAGGGMVPRIEVSGGVAPPPNEFGGNAFANVISPQWFRTFGTRVTAGRDFTERDRQGSPPVAIVNEMLARAFLNGANPLGHTVTLALGRRTTDPPMEIVGVVADAAYNSVRAPIPPILYMPIAQFTAAGPAMLADVNLSVRASSDSPALLTRSVAAAIGTVNPDVALTFRPLADQVNASLTQERVIALLSGFFGALALLLAGLGLYGVTAYAVSCRRTEIGIRMALGAAPAGVVRLVLSRVSILIAVGVIVGTGVSVSLSRFVASLLYELEPRDPATLVGAGVTLAAVGALAGWLPAYRASRIDPAEVLRDS